MACEMLQQFWKHNSCCHCGLHLSGRTQQTSYHNHRDIGYNSWRCCGSVSDSCLTFPVADATGLTVTVIM